MNSRINSRFYNVDSPKVFVNTFKARMRVWIYIACEILTKTQVSQSRRPLVKVVLTFSWSQLACPNKSRERLSIFLCVYTFFKRSELPCGTLFSPHVNAQPLTGRRGRYHALKYPLTNPPRKLHGMCTNFLAVPKSFGLAAFVCMKILSKINLFQNF